MGSDIRQSGRHLHFFKTPAPSKNITGQCRQSGRKDSHAQTGTFAETALAKRADGPGQAYFPQIAAAQERILPYLRDLHRRLEPNLAEIIPVRKGICTDRTSASGDMQH